MNRVLLQNSFSISAGTICHSSLYFKMGHRKILLCHPGTWIDQKLLAKIEQLKEKIDAQIVIDEDLKENFKLLLAHHLAFEFENDLALSKKELIKTFSKMQDEEKSFLNWSIACFEVFNKASVEELNEFHEVDLNLFRKAHLSAAISIWVSLANGYYDPAYLEDIYHITFFQDAGLIHQQYSYYITEALDKESVQPGEGIKYLIAQNASDAEIKLFKDHPFGSYEYIRRLNLLHHPEFANTVLYGHELNNGSGFPFGFTQPVLATWEKIIILSDHLVKYHSTTNYNLGLEIKNIDSLTYKLLPIKKILLRSLETTSQVHQKVSA